MEDDWDLQAVVRGCAATTTSTSSSYSSTTNTTTTTTTTSCSTDDFFVLFPDLFKQENEKIEELHDVFKPYFPKSPPLSPEIIIPISPLSVLGGLQDLSHTKQSVVGPRTTIRHAQSTPRSKRRKNQLKRVCQVAAEGLSSDMWSWRKYGQKPIKGSPYPRGYYRCSTSKGCVARKQVERDRSDPAMFIVTYTGDHNHPMPTHRNSLAGSTRQKPVTSGDANKPSCSPPVSPATSLSPATENIGRREEREDDDDDDEFGVSDMVMSDDFFMGLEEFAGPAEGYSFTWLANSGTTIAGGRG